MIEAAVLVIVAGFAAGIAWIAGSRVATNSVLKDCEERLYPIAAQQLMDELLTNPDTKDDMKRVVRAYVAGRRRIKLDKEHGKLEASLSEYATPVYDYPYKGVTDSALYDLYHRDINPEPAPGPNEFYDGLDTIRGEQDFETWLNSYDRAVKA